jgi:hypothetical protein
MFSSVSEGDFDDVIFFVTNNVCVYINSAEPSGRAV